MKKLIAVMMIAAIMISLISGCKNESESETTTSEMTKEIITELNSETEEFTERDKTEEPTTLKNVKTETVKIENEKYCFTINKTDFEKNYTEDFLMDVTRLVPMVYGYDDYENWDGTPDEVINDALRCVHVSRNNWFFERYESDTPQWEAAINEMKKNPYRISDDFVITDTEIINDFLEDRFGSQVRKFKASDFPVYNEVKISDDSITEGYGLISYRYTYLPECGLIACFTSEPTGFESEAAYIYDIQTVNGMYIVKAVSGSNNYLEKSGTFEDIQASTLKMMNSYTEESLRDYTMTVAYDENGNIYMKSVKSKYILSENIKYNYMVSTDDSFIELRSVELFSKKDEVVDKIPNGTEVFVTLSGGGEAWIITEDYYGYVDEACLVPIEITEAKK